ncbi:MAG TPA: hypothetical protein PKE45_24615, partial [Caldilineaceae bacterium]|nr:hypothetical protein [Caldilineaceae bacterium]
ISFKTTNFVSMPPLFGGGTDQGNTASVESNLRLGLHIKGLDWSLESVGLNLRLGSGIPPRIPSDDRFAKLIGATPGDPDFAQTIPGPGAKYGYYTNVKYPEAFQGSLSLAATFSDSSGRWSVTGEIGWNSGGIRDKTQGTLHDMIGVPRFQIPSISQPYGLLKVTRNF